MTYRIRIADIPVLLIAMAIDIPLLLGFVELCKRGVIDIQSFPNWLFTLLFLSVVGLTVWAMWKRIRNALQR